MATALAITAAPHPLVLRLWELARLAPGWDGRAAPTPSSLACELARSILDVALAAHLMPARVVPDVEGGVALYWFGAETLPGGAHRRVASLSVDNEGTMAAVTEDRATERLDAVAVAHDSVDRTLERIRAFVES